MIFARDFPLNISPPEPEVDETGNGVTAIAAGHQDLARASNALVTADNEIQSRAGAAAASEGADLGMGGVSSLLDDGGPEGRVLASSYD